MKKISLLLALVAVAFTAQAHNTRPINDDGNGNHSCIDCLPAYRVDAKVFQDRLTACDATAAQAQAFDQALKASLYSCAGLKFDSQKPGHPESKRLYDRYCAQ